MPTAGSIFTCSSFKSIHGGMILGKFAGSAKKRKTLSSGNGIQWLVWKIMDTVQRSRTGRSVGTASNTNLSPALSTHISTESGTQVKQGKHAGVRNHRTKPEPL